MLKKNKKSKNCTFDDNAIETFDAINFNNLL